MTTTPNKPDFKKQLNEYTAKKAIDNAFKDAPAVAKAKQGLVPTPKAAKTSPAKGKAGRVVGISADENKFLKTLLLDIIADHSYDEFIEKNKAAYDKLVSRYN